MDLIQLYFVYHRSVVKITFGSGYPAIDDRFEDLIKSGDLMKFDVL